MKSFPNLRNLSYTARLLPNLEAIRHLSVYPSERELMAARQASIEEQLRSKCG
ncbi:hypothetical protein BDW22DRAFT_1353812 [Trametopsis cervina]|nr:hypothetical protein BDW22DRAFT_1353812 [Trametopsis cervina]